MDDSKQPVTPQASVSSNHSPKILIMCLILLVVSVICGVIGYWLGINHQKIINQQQSVNTISSQTAQAPQLTSTIANSGQMEQVYTLGRPLNATGKYKITLAVPISWRATITSSNDEPELFTEFNDNLGQFQFATQTSSNATTYHGPFEPDSNLGFWDVTNWLKTTGPVPNSNSGWDQQIPISQKQAYMNYLINLRNSKKVDTSKCPAIGTGDGTLNCYGTISNTTYIESADKVFSGYAGIGLGYQSVTYNPTVRIYMAGVIDGKTIYAQGIFFIHDKLSQELSNSTNEQAIMDARQQMQKSLPQDTQAQYQQVLASLKSLTITRH